MGGLGDKLEGKADELSGKVKEGVGDATDDDHLQAEGVGEQAEGKVEQAIGEAKDAWEDADRDGACRPSQTGGTALPPPACSGGERGPRSGTLQPSPANDSTSARVSGQGGGDDVLVLGRGQDQQSAAGEHQETADLATTAGRKPPGAPGRCSSPAPGRTPRSSRGRLQHVRDLEVDAGIGKPAPGRRDRRRRDVEPGDGPAEPGQEGGVRAGSGADHQRARCPARAAAGRRPTRRAADAAAPVPRDDRARLLGLGVQLLEPAGRVAGPPTPPPTAGPRRLRDRSPGPR